MSREDEHETIAQLEHCLSELRPTLRSSTYIFATVTPGELANFNDSIIATFREAEGISVIVEEDAARKAGLPTGPCFRCITLQVYSSLEAVGLTAIVATALSDAGISANVVAATHHDHVFVPAVRAEEALAILRGLSKDT